MDYQATLLIAANIVPNSRQIRHWECHLIKIIIRHSLSELKTIPKPTGSPIRQSVQYKNYKPALKPNDRQKWIVSICFLKMEGKKEHFCSHQQHAWNPSTASQIADDLSINTVFIMYVQMYVQTVNDCYMLIFRNKTNRLHKVKQ
jgi:hypothetical protein